ncbi:hypothetical protein [Aestuariirhabdus sp. LZHN29]|uniref:hypothetical protein n=1 Tax=Aestuariirhabdus sp. LZHN29 TaxID=3417462 RepID=UPI003CE9936D
MKSVLRVLGVGVITFVLLLVLVVALLFSWPRPSFEMAPARNFGWTLPTLDQANYHFQVRADGQLEIELSHPLLEGVSPQMLHWWYQQLPVGWAQWQQRRYSYYHLFHPSEHGVIHVLEPALDGAAGMGEGALVYRQERFGPYYSKGRGRILRFDQRGMLVAPEMGSLQFGRIEHHFEAVEGGTRYRVRSLLGSQLPLVGPLINAYIVHKRFPPEVLEQWLRHQVEEVGTLPHFLPDLYRTAQQLEAGVATSPGPANDPGYWQIVDGPAG